MLRSKNLAVLPLNTPRRVPRSNSDLGSNTFATGGHGIVYFGACYRHHATVRQYPVPLDLGRPRSVPPNLRLRLENHKAVLDTWKGVGWGKRSVCRFQYLPPHHTTCSPRVESSRHLGICTHKPTEHMQDASNGSKYNLGHILPVTSYRRTFYVYE